MLIIMPLYLCNLIKKLRIICQLIECLLDYFVKINNKKKGLYDDDHVDIVYGIYRDWLCRFGFEEK